MGAGEERLVPGSAGRRAQHPCRDIARCRARRAPRRSARARRGDRARRPATGRRPCRSSAGGRTRTRGPCRGGGRRLRRTCGGRVRAGRRRRSGRVVAERDDAFGGHTIRVCRRGLRHGPGHGREKEQHRVAK